MLGGRLTLTESVPVNMIVGLIFQMAWIQILDLSFLPINSLIAISIPGTSSSIQTLMIKYIYFDIFYTELWID
jgi:hypothetical protein